MLPVEEEEAPLSAESPTNKENNDSAIGLNATADYSKSLSPTTSCSAPVSSKGSSPDSGASSASPKSTTSEGIAELDKLLSSTKISPLGKNEGE